MPWAPDYVTADEVAAFARVDDDVDDVDYGRVATTASRAIDHDCHRQFGRTASETRLYTPRWSSTRGMWIITTDDFVVVTQVEIDRLGDGIWEVVDLTKFRKLASDANADKKDRPWEKLGVRAAYLPSFSYATDCIRVTAEYGWASVPVAIKEATLLQASRLAARRDSPYGIAGSPDSGSEIRLLARLDPDVLTSVKDYVRKVRP